MCVKLKAGATIEAGALIKFVKEQVADYKVPDKLLIVDRFPMTASGKIMKIALQNKLKESLKGELR
ncbi:hypothetical protein QS257_02045 [Terrilactibacillus sp. S3-3]|nr:hypothetical protein QS257_02045 [Terrilactibacillus sp. S3-3]